MLRTAVDVPRHLGRGRWPNAATLEPEPGSSQGDTKSFLDPLRRHVWIVMDNLDIVISLETFSQGGDAEFGAPRAWFPVNPLEIPILFPVIIPLMIKVWSISTADLTLPTKLNTRSHLSGEVDG